VNQLNATNLNVTGMSGGLMLPSIGGTASLLNHYGDYSHSTAFNGPATTSSMIFKLVRVGKAVTMSATGIQLTATSSSSTYFRSSTPLLPFLTPVQSVSSRCSVMKSGLWNQGTVTITNDGDIQVWGGSEGSNNEFPASGQVGIMPFTISWVCR